MAFEIESPGGKRYLYASRRDPETGRVRKVYLGAGPRAEAAARELEEGRNRRGAERLALELRQCELRPADELMAALHEAAGVLLEATLLAAGYHRRNYGPWRRRRRRDDDGGHRGAAPAGGAG